jgi:thiol-disulfide isomerase/thioredoxin
MSYMKKIIVSMMAAACLFRAGAQQQGGVHKQGSAGQQAGAKVIIRGKLAGDPKGYNKVYMYSGHGGSTDSAIIQNGTFTFEMPFTEPTFRLFYLEYTVKNGMMYTPFGVLIDKPAILTMTGDINKGLDKSVVTGSRTEELYQAYNTTERTASGRVYDSLKSLYGKLWLEDGDPQAAAFAKSKDSLQQLYMAPLIIRFVKAHPDSYASAFILSGAAKEALNTEQMETVYNMLSPGNKKTEPAKEFLAFSEGLKNSAIGRQVKNFILPDPNGNPYSFDNLKGKYVIIDFWASWCSPCRQSFPRMRKIYEKFKGNKFEMYSISIDQSKEAWLKAVKEENNPWIQTLDTKKVSKSGFAITGVPTTYLIDPNGKIIMKQVGIDPDSEGPLEKKLNEILQ